MLKKIVQVFLFAGLLFNLAQQAESQQKKRQTNNKQRRSVQPKNLTAEEIARRFLPSVVLIVCDDGKEKLSQGSGFFIRPGVILTNYHVIDGMVRGKAKTVSEQSASNEWWIEKVLYTDSKNDLALLLIKETNKTKIPTLSLSVSDNPSIGETIYVLSNPEGLTGTISKGIISSGIRKIKNIELLQIDAPISSGSSGGAVLNARGDVIGIATGSLSSGQNLNFAVPSSQIKSFIKRYDSLQISISYDRSFLTQHSWLQEQVGVSKQGESAIGDKVRKVLNDMEFIYINPGSFDYNGGEYKPNRIRIEKGFFIGKYEVTQSQWQAVMGNNPSYFKNCPSCPVENVSWEDIQQFIARLNATDERFTYRLPKDVEWEYVAKAGDSSDSIRNLDMVAWYRSNSEKKTHVVGTKQANAWGLYDMLGNVWEFCGDYDSPGYHIRGGAWNVTAGIFGFGIPTGFQDRLWKDYSLGFRLIRDNKSNEEKKSYTKTEGKSELTYEKITESLSNELQGASGTASNIKNEVRNISFSQCNMNLLIIKDDYDKTENSWEANLGFLNNVRDHHNNGKYLIELEFERNMTRHEKQKRWDGLEDIYFEKVIEIPLEGTERILQVSQLFEELRKKCVEKTQSSLKKKVSIQETTDWLKGKIANIYLVFGKDKVFYKVQFSDCNMLLTKLNVFPWGTETLVYDTNLRFLETLDINNRTSEFMGASGWGVHFKFSKFYDLKIQKTDGKVVVDKGAIVSIYLNNIEDAKKIGIAFEHLKELCFAESKEPF